MPHKHRPIAFFLFLLTLAGACQKHRAASASARSYRIGFANSAPGPDYTLYMQSLNLWPQHSDATIISTEVPWDSLLAGEDPIAYVENDYAGLVSYCRSKHLLIWVYIDPENGLNRASDSDPLVAAGRSIAQTAIQQLYRRFVLVADSILQPDHLGLALETNLIRIAAPDSIYQGVVKAAVAAAADVRAIDGKVPLSVSVQVETAWGKLNGNGTYLGVDQDFADFPFLQELGLSSYPYLGYTSPGDLPLNYYSQLVTGHLVPVFVSEGGWTSANIPLQNGQAIQSSLALQQSYIDRQGQLLDEARAIGLFQLTFTDLSLSGFSATLAAGLQPFAFLGVVDTAFTPKPALEAWDSLFHKPLEAGH